MTDVANDWWGCRRCPKVIRRDTWKAHGHAHAMVQSAVRLKIATDRATDDNLNLLLCGVCGTGFAEQLALMGHIETKHLEVVSEIRNGKTRPSW
jgi:hypothetical protein